MTATYDIDGAGQGTVKRGSVELVEMADKGTVGAGRFVIDDVAGSIDLVAHKAVEVTETACADPLIVSGFVGTETFARGVPKAGVSREIAVTVNDLNALLSDETINPTNAEGKRLAETVSARVAWALTFIPGVADNGRVQASSVMMDKAKYGNSKPGDILADCALAAGNFDWAVVDYGDGPELIFRDQNASTEDSSALRISNDLADLNANTFHPHVPDTMTRDPDNVYSVVDYTYAKGTIRETRAATATAFRERHGTASNTHVKTAAQARRQAKRFLFENRVPGDEFNQKILVPASKVNLVRAGYRIQVKRTDLVPENYDDFTWCRVLQRTVRSLLKPAAKYQIEMRLSPQEEGQPAPLCNFDATPSGDYWPLGVGSPSNYPALSDGVVFYFRSGLANPVTPGDTSYQGRWHFGVWGAGGAGSIDYAGDCTQNKLYLLTVGNGTWTIQTEQGSAPRTLYAQAGSLLVPTSLHQSSFAAGGSVVIEIDDTTDDDCIRRVLISDTGYPCGSKWGWSGAEWVAA